MKRAPKRKGRPGRGERTRFAGYVRQELADRFVQLQAIYPRITQTDLVEAAIEFYLQHADGGLDANLQPWPSSGPSGAGSQKKTDRTLSKAG